MKRLHSQRRRVEFHETDMAGIMHFSNFFSYMESVEHGYFRSLGTSAHPSPEGDGTQRAWLRVNATCDFRAPLRYGDEVYLELFLAKLGRTSVQYEVRFSREGVTEAAIGKMTTVYAIRREEGGKWRPESIPTALAEQLQG